MLRPLSVQSTVFTQKNLYDISLSSSATLLLLRIEVGGAADGDPKVQGGLVKRMKSRLMVIGVALLTMFSFAGTAIPASAAVALTGITADPAGPYVFTKDLAIDAIAIEPNAGADPAPTYAVSPALPTGLTLNTSTGVISGEPTVAAAQALYTVTATQTGTPDITKTLELQITVRTTPSSTTGAASSVTSNSAVLNGIINTGFDSTEVRFCYGIVTPNEICLPATQSPVSGVAPVASLGITGLTANTKYFFRVESRNGADVSTWSLGATLEFTTNSAPAPTITGINPSAGPIAGNTLVTISGTNLTGATTVTFGGTEGTSVTVVSATQITVRTPAKAAGTAAVVVTTPGGSTTEAFSYIYRDAPVISTIAPVSGPTIGGTVVTITGTNFAGVTGVTFGGVAGTNLSIDGGGTVITVTTPARPAGVQTVVVTSPGGTDTSSNTGTEVFTYVAVAPTITGISPTSGPLAGGTTVTITGTNLTGATSVKFGTTAAVITTNTATSLVVTSPVRTTAGAVDIEVITPGGTVETSSAQRFTYLALPTITRVEPSAGPLAGGNTVTISGTGLTGTTSVTFGGTAGTSVTVNSSGTSLTVVAPAKTAGVAAIVITTPGGSVTSTTSLSYTYTAAPTAPTGVTATAGITSATVSWTAVSGATSYAVTSNPAGCSVTATATTASCPTLVAGRAYTFTVVASNAGGSSAASTASTAITPRAATVTKTKKVTIKFAVNSNRVTADNVRRLQVALGQIEVEEGSQLRIAVNGFTRAVGATPAELARALKRAQAVERQAKKVGMVGTYTVTATGKAKKASNAQKVVVTITYEAKP